MEKAVQDFLIFAFLWIDFCEFPISNQASDYAVL